MVPVRCKLIAIVWYSHVVVAVGQFRLRLWQQYTADAGMSSVTSNHHLQHVVYTSPAHTVYSGGMPGMTWPAHQRSDPSPSSTDHHHGEPQRMADVRSIFGGAFIPPPPRIPEPPERQLIDAMLDAGITTPPETVIMDGRLHRFSTGTKSDRKKTGWYVAYGDGIPAGRFGCWRSGIDEPWRAEVSRDLTDADRIIMSRRQAEAMAARDAARQATAESVADVVSRIWAGSAVADDAHPYLARKGISGHGARVTGDGRLVVPMYTADGELSSLQYISADGEKLYHAGGATKGCMWWLGDITDAGPVYLAEGYATAASIHQATGRPCFIAYSAQNLVPVAEAIRRHHADLTIVADNDKSGVGERARRTRRQPSTARG
jgi:putative DNA primase/helicase